jgi:hypothetical protein
VELGADQGANRAELRRTVAAEGGTMLKARDQRAARLDWADTEEVTGFESSIAHQQRPAARARFIVSPVSVGRTRSALLTRP